MLSLTSQWPSFGIFNNVRSFVSAQNGLLVFNLNWMKLPAIYLRVLLELSLRFTFANLHFLIWECALSLSLSLHSPSLLLTIPLSFPFLLSPSASVCLLSVFTTPSLSLSVSVSFYSSFLFSVISTEHPSDSSLPVTVTKTGICRASQGSFRVLVLLHMDLKRDPQLTQKQGQSMKNRPSFKGKQSRAGTYLTILRARLHWKLGLLCDFNFLSS